MTEKTRVLILMHVETEGPGTLGDFLLQQGADLQACRLYDGDPIPGDADGFSAVVSMGGPMNVYEEERYPFLKEGTFFLRQTVQSGVPVLGICLGAQMIAKACGASVIKAPRKEIGWCGVELTPEGHGDPLFLGVPETLDVFQWHHDMFEVPSGGTLLATGGDCPHQAFRVLNAYGLQFHVEVTREMLDEWFEESPRLDQMLSFYDNVGSLMNRNATRMYENFFDLAWTKRQTDR